MSILRIILATAGAAVVVVIGVSGVAIWLELRERQQAAVTSAPAEARQALSPAPADPKPMSPLKLGNALLRGNGVDKDTERGLATLVEALATKDAAAAAYDLGEIYRRGSHGVAPDPLKADLYLKQAISLGHKTAPLVLGRSLLRGDGVNADTETGIALLDQIIGDEKNGGAAAFELGRFFLRGHGDVSADPEKARSYLQASIDAGYRRAAVTLGRALLRGEGLEANPEAGTALLEAELEPGGETGAAGYELGQVYLKGNDHVTADPERARGYLFIAADAGNIDAANLLGRELLSGVAMPKDIEAGVFILETYGLESNKPGPAARELATFYFLGDETTAPNRAKAMTYLQRGLDDGDKDARIAVARTLVKDAGEASIDNAIALFEAEIAAGGNIAAAAFELGSIHLRRARADSSAGAETAAAVSAADDPPALGGTADVYGFRLGGFTGQPMPVSATATTVSGQGPAMLARRYLEQAAAAGHKDAPITLGRALMRGDGVAADVAAGQAMLEREIATERNRGAAAFELGSFYLGSGALGPGDPEKAQGYLDVAVAAGHSRATTAYGRWLLNQDDPADIIAGIAMLEKQASDGKDVGQSASALGSFFLKGRAGIEADARKARHYLDQAISAGHIDSLLTLGRALLRGNGLPLDQRTAIALLERAAAEERLKGSASFDLGAFYLRGGDQVGADAGKAKRYLEQAVAAGNNGAPTALGRAILRGDLPGDSRTGVALLERQIAAKRDVSSAAFTLGTFFLKGDAAVSPNPGKARTYLDRAIAEGNKDAVRTLGRALVRGDGLPIDREAGARMLASLAEGEGNANGTLNLDLGRAYLANDNPDPHRAREYLERAAAEGRADAWVDLGRAALDGKFGENGGEAAAAYFRKAIAAGNAGAVTRLARIYIDGRGGVRRDVRNGMQILHQAADTGNQEAMRELMTIYLTGIRRQVTKDPRRARAVFERYRQVANADDVKVQAVLIEAGDDVQLLRGRPALFAKVLALYLDVPASRRGTAAQQLFRINRDASIYVAQALLKSAGLYDGAVNGVFGNDTIAAIDRACRRGGEGKCGAKTLHAETIGFIARNFG